MHICSRLYQLISLYPGSDQNNLQLSAFLFIILCCLDPGDTTASGSQLAECCQIFKLLSHIPHFVILSTEHRKLFWSLRVHSKNVFPHFKFTETITGFQIKNNISDPGGLVLEHVTQWMKMGRSESLQAPVCEHTHMWGKGVFGHKVHSRKSQYKWLFSSPLLKWHLSHCVGHASISSDSFYPTS